MMLKKSLLIGLSKIKLILLLKIVILKITILLLKNSLSGLKKLKSLLLLTNHLRDVLELNLIELMFCVYANIIQPFLIRLLMIILIQG